MPTPFVARQQDQLLKDLGSLLSIPSISALPAHAVDCRRAAEWLMADLVRLGDPRLWRAAVADLPDAPEPRT